MKQSVLRSRGANAFQMSKPYIILLLFKHITLIQTQTNEDTCFIKIDPLKSFIKFKNNNAWPTPAFITGNLFYSYKDLTNQFTWGVSLRLSSTNPEFELYFVYCPSMKCSRWNSGESGRLLNSRMDICSMSTYRSKKDEQLFKKGQVKHAHLLHHCVAWYFIQ